MILQIVHQGAKGLFRCADAGSGKEHREKPGGRYLSLSLIEAERMLPTLP
jgi:hypothetical protein